MRSGKHRGVRDKKETIERDEKSIAESFRQEKISAESSTCAEGRAAKKYRAAIFRET